MSVPTIRTYARKKRAVKTVSNSPNNESGSVIEKLLAKNMLKRKLSVKKGRKKRRKKSDESKLPVLPAPKPTTLFLDDTLEIRINSTFDDLFQGPVYNSVKYKSGSFSVINSSSEKSRSIENSVKVVSWTKPVGKLRKVQKKTPNKIQKVKKKPGRKPKKLTNVCAEKNRSNIPKILCESINESLVIENEIKRNQSLELSKYLNYYPQKLNQYKSPNVLLNSFLMPGLNMLPNKMQAESTPKYIHSTPINRNRFKSNNKNETVSPINDKSNHSSFKLSKFTKMLDLNESKNSTNLYVLVQESPRKICIHTDIKLNSKAVVVLDNAIDLLGINARLTCPKSPDNIADMTMVDSNDSRVSLFADYPNKEWESDVEIMENEVEEINFSDAQLRKRVTTRRRQLSNGRKSYAVNLEDWETFSNSLFQKKRDKLSANSVITIEDSVPNDDCLLPGGKAWRRSLLLYKRSRSNTSELMESKDHQTSTEVQKTVFNQCSINKLNTNVAPRKSLMKIVSLRGRKTRSTINKQKSSSNASGFISTVTDDPVLEKLEELSLNADDRRQTAREIVLAHCGQIQPVSFDKCFPPKSLEKCRKIGEGVYGEVFMRKHLGQCLVMKIIPIEGSLVVNGEHQKKYEEIISEIIIASELSNLRAKNKNYTDGFAEVVKVSCVQGQYPKSLLDLWDLYDEDRGSENDSPEIFSDDQLYVVLELSNGGQDLEAYQFQSAEQSHSIFLQTACALAVAEAELEFEHRDMHWGNVLITKTDEPTVLYRLRGREFELPTKGVKVTVIDFTLSRMTYQNCCIYNDLAMDPDLFTAKGDYQFEIYRLMRKRNNDEWQHYEPYSNILWLDYALDKILTQVHYTSKNTKTHKTHLRKLTQLKKKVLTFSSAAEFVNSDIFLDVFL